MSKGQITGLISPILERIRLRNIAKHVKGKRVLDVGCGRCALRNYIGNVEYFGIERDKGIDVPDKIEIFYHDVETDDLRDIGKYDSIVLCEIIEHFQNPKDVIDKLKRHLNDNGIIIISTSVPFRYKIHKYTSMMGLTSKEASEEHKSLLGKDDIYKFANDCGLIVKSYKRKELWTKQIVVLGE